MERASGSAVAPVAPGLHRGGQPGGGTSGLRCRQTPGSPSHGGAAAGPGGCLGEGGAHRAAVPAGGPPLPAAGGREDGGRQEQEVPAGFQDAGRRPHPGGHQARPGEGVPPTAGSHPWRGVQRVQEWAGGDGGGAGLRHAGGHGGPAALGAGARAGGCRAAGGGRAPGRGAGGCGTGRRGAQHPPPGPGHLDRPHRLHQRVHRWARGRGSGRWHRPGGAVLSTGAHRCLRPPHGLPGAGRHQRALLPPRPPDLQVAGEVPLGRRLRGHAALLAEPPATAPQALRGAEPGGGGDGAGGLGTPL